MRQALTLLEVLIVCVLMAAVMAMGATSLRHQQVAPLRQSERMLRQACQDAQWQALQTGRPVQLWVQGQGIAWQCIDTDDVQYQYIRLPDGVVLRLLDDAGERIDAVKLTAQGRGPELQWHLQQGAQQQRVRWVSASGQWLP